MILRKYTVTCILVILGFMLLTTGCSIKHNNIEIGELRTESETVELDRAHSVDTEIMMGAGKLTVSGGAKKLLKAGFIYNAAKLKPEIDYNINGEKGNLVIKQPPVKYLNFSENIRYEWNLQLNDTVPMDLKVQLGAGESCLDLGGLSLNSLEINMGAGNTTVDLAGSWKNDLDVNIKSGVGQMTLKVPENTGVKIDAEKGIGQINAHGLKKNGSSYVNDAYGETDVNLHIDIKEGIGEINLELGE